LAAKKDELAFYADRSTDSALRTRNGHVSNMRREPSISSMGPWVLAEIATRADSNIPLWA